MNLIKIELVGTDYRDIRHQAARLFGFTENTEEKAGTPQAVTPFPEVPEEIAEPKKAAPKKKNPIPKIEVVEADPLPEVAEPITPEPAFPEPDPVTPAAVEPSSMKEELREALKQMVAAEKEAEAKVILEKYGASVISKIQEKDYAAILAELKAVL